MKMRPEPRPSGMSWLSLALGLAILAFAGNMMGQEPAQPNGEQEVLTRGPVHEAFAGPVVFERQQGAVAPKRPPEEIDEVPPDEKPEGDVLWIPGYWHYDDERQDYVWVSGIWRTTPPGMRWVPGYWHRVGAGYQWTGGFWQNATADEVEYLPEPPASLENGPNVPQPSDNHFWVPGTYLWTSNRYAWRPGYWSVCQPNWVWHPASYYWTPSGYVFVNGYWDYPLDHRGLLYAPCYFAPSYVVRRPRFVPSVVIQTPGLIFNFFARPRYRHYYFGDYYAPIYVEQGFRPWCRFDRIGYRYDPLFSYYSVSYGRTDRLWRSRMMERYDRLVVDASLRPPRTFAAQQRAIQAGGARGSTVDAAFALGAPTSQLAVAMRFEKMSAEQRQATSAIVHDVQRFRTQRAQLESAPSIARVNGGGNRLKTVRLTDAPIVDPQVRLAGNLPRGEKGVAGSQNRSGEKGAGISAPAPGRNDRKDSVGAKIGDPRIGRPDRGRSAGDNSSGVARTDQAPGDAARNPMGKAGILKSSGDQNSTNLKVGSLPGQRGADSGPDRPRADPDSQPGKGSPILGGAKTGGNMPPKGPGKANVPGQLRPDRRVPPPPTAESKVNPSGEKSSPPSMPGGAKAPPGSSGGATAIPGRSSIPAKSFEQPKQPTLPRSNPPERKQLAPKGENIVEKVGNPGSGSVGGKAPGSPTTEKRRSNSGSDSRGRDRPNSDQERKPRGKG